MEVRMERYRTELQPVWDHFIRESKNGLFLFERAYMEYHADRFTDHSLLFYKADELLAVLPANEKKGVLHSHGGLTYGGMVLSKRASIVFVLQAFAQLKEYLEAAHFQTCIYKSIPFIHYKLPAQEDAYALFQSGAELYRRDISSVIDLTQTLSYTKGTRSNLSKARKNGLYIEPGHQFDTFMQIEEDILQKKYNTRPTHTAAEISYLAERFPENIKLFLVYKETLCLGGTIVYLTPQVLHTQYIGITDDGKEMGALDALTDYLLQHACGGKRYFSFGISTEQEGRVLNEGLIRNKESFGARAVVHDFYKISV